MQELDIKKRDQVTIQVEHFLMVSMLSMKVAILETEMCAVGVTCGFCVVAFSKI